MSMDQAAVWLAGSILFSLGLVSLVAGIVVINNMFHRYWKPVPFFKWADPMTPRFASEEEMTQMRERSPKNNE